MSSLLSPESNSGTKERLQKLLDIIDDQDKKIEALTELAIRGRIIGLWKSLSRPHIYQYEYRADDDFLDGFCVSGGTAELALGLAIEYLFSRKSNQGAIT